MTFEQIAYFLAVADMKSFVQAARRCGISQPSLTNAIRSLETTLGGPLFVRTTTGSKLTEFGRQAYPLLARLHQDRLHVLKQASKWHATRPVGNLRTASA
jgi:LysR family transcriptional regulator, carnitine catabolism transcriptional activator